VAIFVGYKLLGPGHRVAINLGRREKLHTAWHPHHKTIRPEVGGVHNKGYRHLRMTIAITDITLHSVEVIHHS
jgi:hypothetical protein